MIRWEFLDHQPIDDEIRAAITGAGDARGGREPMNINEFGHRAQLADLANAIRLGTPLRLDGREGRRAVELITGIYHSMRTGKPYRFE